MLTLLIATRNTHKLEEIRSVLGDGIDYQTLADYPLAPQVVEDATSFAGNAAKKAEQLAAWLVSSRSLRGGKSLAEAAVLADDSGLEVDFLEGAPGVLSARFAASHAGSDAAANAPDAANNAKLLKLLEAVPAEKRTARFRCVLALSPVVFGSEGHGGTRSNEARLTSTICFEGSCEGRIGYEPHGASGFGYDPLFTPDGHHQTFAELGAPVKNRISHRARALQRLKQFLQSPD